MSVYNPPIENVPIFDSALFRNTNSTTGTLTIPQADQRYLKFPIAQGNETLQSVVVSGSMIVSGTSTFNSNATFNSTADIIQETSSQILQKPTYPTLSSSGNVFNQSVFGTSGQGSASGVQVRDTTTTKSISFIVNTSDNVFNKIINAGDSGIFATSAPLVLTNSTGGNSTNGLRLDNTSITLGIGGAVDIPTNSIILNSNGTTNFNSTTPPTSSQTIPASSDSSTNIPTTAWVQSAIVAGGGGGGGGVNYTYTEVFSTSSPTGLNITIPNNCVKFDITLFGTGGTTVGYTVGVPDGGHPDYYYKAPATGGGAQVVKSSFPINIPTQGSGKTSTLLLKGNAPAIVYSGGNSTQLLLNGFNVAEAGNGLTGSATVAGGATTATPYTNPNYSSWIINQGAIGAPNSEDTFSPNSGQLGGPNFFGGISGYNNGGNQNTMGQGQLYGSLIGPNYGLPIYPASPINYGGVHITWYILKP